MNIVFAYQWQHCDATNFCLNVGTNSATYTTVVADAGYTIQVVVTGANDASSATATSARTSTITQGPQPVNTVLPTITLTATFDAPQLGFFLTASTGTWTGIGPITFTYQWTKCDDKLATKPCYDIPGATTSFFYADGRSRGLGHQRHRHGHERLRLLLRARAADAAGHRSPAGEPRLAASHRRELCRPDADDGHRDLDGLLPITFAIQWKRCDAFGTLTSCVAIAGATGRTYALQQADLALTIRSFVTATNAVGSAVRSSRITRSRRCRRVTFAPTVAALPQVTGTPRPRLPAARHGRDVER